MGEVYRAEDTSISRHVAIKVLPPDKVGDPERTRRFVQEAKAASALNQTSTIFIFIFAGIILKEPVNFRRITSIIAAFAGVAVIDNLATVNEGNWEYKTRTGVWTAISRDISDTTALVLGVDTAVWDMLRFVPIANYNTQKSGGPGNLIVRLWDGTSEARGTLDPTGKFGGTGPFSNDQVTLQTTVNNVNDAPVAANDSYTTAEDTLLGRPVAIKALAPEHTSDPQHRERLRREARIAATLSHPGIATVYALEECDGDLYIIYEYVRGQTLQGHLQPIGRFWSTWSGVVRRAC
jgi:serine/threonine protein kinase